MSHSIVSNPLAQWSLLVTSRATHGFKQLQTLSAGDQIVPGESHPGTDRFAIIVVQVFELSAAVAEAQRALAKAPVEVVCADDAEGCRGWSKDGECEKNPGYMKVHCKLSCGLCKGEAAPKEKAPEKKVPGNVQGVGSAHRSRCFCAPPAPKICWIILCRVWHAAASSSHHSQSAASQTASRQGRAAPCDCLRLMILWVQKLARPWQGRDGLFSR